MSSKPGTVPTFNSGAVNVATLSAGRIASGYANGAVPTAGELNYVFMWLALWAQYLSDGNFSGAATFASTLGVTGLVTASAGVTCGANQNVTVSGTGAYKHGTQTLTVPLIANYQGSIAPTNAITLPTGNFQIVWFQLPAGKRVTAVRVGVIDSATGPTKLQCSTYTVTSAGSAAAQTLGAQSAGSGAQQTITATGLTTTIVAGSIYGVYVIRSTGTASCTINNIEVDYDQP